MSDEGPAPEDLPTPWSFKIMVMAVALYLGWRLVQALAWVWERIF